LQTRASRCQPDRLPLAGPRQRPGQHQDQKEADMDDDDRAVLDRIEAKIDRVEAKLGQMLAERAVQSIDQADTVSAGAEPDATSKLVEIRQSAADMGIPIFEGTVSEIDAARLLGRSVLTLRNRRLTDQPIPYERVGRSIRYKLSALAEHLGT
jgi:hypothetical protein